MSEKKSLFVTILGIANIIKCLFGGLVYLVLGLLLTLTPGGQGLQAIFGIPAIFLGIVLLRGVKPAFLLLRGHLQGRKATIVISLVSLAILLLPLLWFLVPVAFFVLIVNLLNFSLFVPRIANQFGETSQEALTSWEKKFILISCIILPILLTSHYINSYRFSSKISNFNPYNPTAEMVRSMNDMISNEFKKHHTVVLEIYCFPNYFDEFHYKKSSEAERKLIDTKFIRDSVLKDIASQDIKHFKGRHYDFIVEVTEIGYEKLRQSKYVRAIELFDTKIYGKHLWD